LKQRHVAAVKFDSADEPEEAGVHSLPLVN